MFELALKRFIINVRDGLLKGFAQSVIIRLNIIMLNEVSAEVINCLFVYHF